VTIMPKKSWTEKLTDSKGFPKIEPITEKMSKRWGQGTVVIPAPMDVYGIMASVPEGELITINDIRSALAKKYGSTICCPICTGIFARIAASASEEGKGVKKIPYWRTLKEGRVINEKYPGGIEGQKRLLEKEGHLVVKKGNKYNVMPKK
jgi:alkylated DNA nucleotide flippase Atl1